jgi:hypothetical protein
MYTASIVSARQKTSGLAQRTLKNLHYLEQAQSDGADVHIVTQVVNSLLALLVFPLAKEPIFFDPYRAISLPSSVCPSGPDAAQICATINATVSVPSLQVRSFDRCPDLATFFKKIRNAISHKNVDFDSDSLSLAAVHVTLRDRLNDAAPFDWEILMTAEDLRTIALYVGDEIVRQSL